VQNKAHFMRAKKSAAGAALEDYHQRRMEECTEELRIFSTSTVSYLASRLSSSGYSREALSADFCVLFVSLSICFISLLLISLQIVAFLYRRVAGAGMAPWRRLFSVDQAWVATVRG
jgi:hypothetical protein